MERKKLIRDMIFYNPGLQGAAFTISAGSVVDKKVIESTKNHLEYETEKRVSYVEDRRNNIRNFE